MSDDLMKLRDILEGLESTLQLHGGSLTQDTIEPFTTMVIEALVVMVGLLLHTRSPQW